MATLMGPGCAVLRGADQGEKTQPRAIANLVMRVIRRSVLHALLHMRFAIRLDLL